MVVLRFASHCIAIALLVVSIVGDRRKGKGENEERKYAAHTKLRSKLNKPHYASHLAGMNIKQTLTPRILRIVKKIAP